VELIERQVKHMKLKDVIWLLQEDAFYIYINEKNHDKCEYIEATAKGSWVALRKYFELEVTGIWREEYGMGILLKKLGGTLWQDLRSLIG
jgi:hypothetical protein